MFKKILSVLLYALPIVFFTVCYFLIVTSGEDIFQGANTMPDVIGDSVAAFNHSARLADMYAWSSINFFDYTFCFGPDTIFRIIDVIVAFFIFYSATFIALGHRPKLALKDGLVFAGIFLAVMLTSYGTTLYGGFSKIHNYLFISIITLGFCLIYFKDLIDQKPFHKTTFLRKLAIPIMLVFGFIFGLTSSVTGIAFLLCLPIYLIFLKVTRQKIAIKKFVFSWRGASILGILIALFCIYVIGPGLADYDTNPAYLAVSDYLPFRDVFTNLGDSIVHIIKHMAFNFGRFLVPFIILTIPVVIYLTSLKIKNQLVLPKFSRREKNFFFATISFIIVHILALSQIYYYTRMVLPVYLIGLAVYVYILIHIIKPAKITIPLALIEITLMLIIITIRTTFAIQYLAQVSPILDRIKNFNETSFCVTPEQVKSKNLPYIYLGQEDFLVDWAMPQKVYDKTVDFCK